MSKARNTEVYAAFRACRLWRSAADDTIANLASAARVTTEPRGSLIITEGDPAERLAIVVEGKVRVYQLGADGRTFTFEVLSAGDALAAVAALAGTRYPANAETTTSAILAWVCREQVLELAASEPAVARDIISDLATRVVDFTSVVASLSLDVPARLARFLFGRALAGGTPTGEGLIVELGMSKTELAAALGTVPETLSRAFARLRDAGHITVRSRQVIIRDVGAIARLGAGYTEE